MAEFKEFKPRLKYGWFHFKMYSMFQNLSRRSIETGFFADLRRGSNSLNSDTGFTLCPSRRNDVNILVINRTGKYLNIHQIQPVSPELTLQIRYFFIIPQNISENKKKIILEE